MDMDFKIIFRWVLLGLNLDTIYTSYFYYLLFLDIIYIQIVVRDGLFGLRVTH